MVRRGLCGALMVHRLQIHWHQRQVTKGDSIKNRCRVGVARTAAQKGVIEFHIVLTPHLGGGVGNEVRSLNSLTDSDCVLCG
jgi:hypothetical protein